jgi:REP element-mobilizing transposase RayT
MARTLGRGHECLRRGRSSAIGAEYFLTICTAENPAALSAPATSCAVLEEAHRLTETRIWSLRTATVMPDHIHLLVILGERDLCDALRLFKGHLTPVLRAAGARWQRGYYDHRMRDDDERLPVFLYIFLNPYRAGLLNAGQSWPGYDCSPNDQIWFEPLTNCECPFPEWLT